MVNEHHVVVKQNPIFVRVMLIIIACIFSGLVITVLILSENNYDLWVAFWLSIPVVVCLFFAITAKLYIKAKDTYTATGMIRKRGDKVLYELEWENVEKITYNRLSLMSIFMFGPTAFLIFQKEQPVDKKQARTFLTYYSMREVKKIQTIIPLEIQF